MWRYRAGLRGLLGRLVEVRTDTIAFQFRSCGPASILRGFAAHEFVSLNKILVRLSGLAVVERFGYEMIGKNYLSKSKPSRQREVFDALSKIIDCPYGMLVHVRMFRESGEMIDYEVLGLPFRNGQGTANLATYHTDNLNRDRSCSRTMIDGKNRCSCAGCISISARVFPIGTIPESSRDSLFERFDEIIWSE